MPSLPQIPLARYRLDFIVDAPLMLPAFAGSAIRGVFGGALRASACMTKAKTCDTCPLLASCPYAVVFEPRPPTVGHPLQDFKALVTQAETLVSDKQFTWRDWTRYSSRQQQKVDLGGVVGRWQLTGEPPPFLSFLCLGKEAVFGLDGYHPERHP